MVVTFRWVPPIVTPLMLARTVRDGAAIQQHWMRLRDMSPALTRVNTLIRSSTRVTESPCSLSNTQSPTQDAVRPAARTSDC
jgi:hypothetical protein